MPLPTEGERSRTDNLRYAPSFVVSSGAIQAPLDHAYNALSLATFLGMVKKGGSSGTTASLKLRIALNALALEEERIIPMYSVERLENFRRAGRIAGRIAVISGQLKLASRIGARLGAHVRWHVMREIYNPECELCAAATRKS